MTCFTDYNTKLYWRHTCRTYE